MLRRQGALVVGEDGLRVQKLVCLEMYLGHLNHLWLVSLVAQHSLLRLL